MVRDCCKALEATLQCIRGLADRASATTKCRCAPADVALRVLICLGLQDLTGPPDLHVQGLCLLLGRRLTVLAMSLLLVRCLSLLGPVACCLCCAALSLLLAADCFCSNAMSSALLCQGDRCCRPLSFRSEPRTRLPTRFAQQLAS